MLSDIAHMNFSDTGVAGLIVACVKSRPLVAPEKSRGSAMAAVATRAVQSFLYG